MQLSSRTYRRIPALLLVALAALLAAPTSVPAAEKKADAKKAKAKGKKPPITVAIVLEPEFPGPDTLCKLRVKLENHTDRDISGLGFRVRVNGTDLPVYENQRYMDALDPGGKSEIELYNFWSSETGRPPRKDGSLLVEVDLIEARFLKRTVEEDVPVWTLLDEVPGLPSSASVKRSKK